VKLILTGAAGFIGSHTAERLVGLGHEVVGVDRFDDYLYPAAPKRANAAALAAALPADRFRLVEADVADDVAFDAVVAAARPDVICHLAALAGVRPSLAEPLRYSRTNVHGTTVVLEACRKFGVQRHVFASSSSVYGARPDADLAEPIAFVETDPCLHPASPYAATKRAGELLCSTYRDLYGIGSASLRFFTVYGPRQRPDMAIARFTAAIAAGRPLQLFGDGSSRRDYTYVDDIVAGVVASCERLQPGRNEVYNLGGTATTSLAELVRLLEEVIGRPAVIERLPLQPGDVPITYADVSRAALDLGYAPTVSIREGLARFWAWHQRHRA
jgi:UDP-glucuronate 4-epimerase